MIDNDWVPVAAASREFGPAARVLRLWLNSGILIGRRNASGDWLVSRESLRLKLSHDGLPKMGRSRQIGIVIQLKAQLAEMQRQLNVYHRGYLELKAKMAKKAG